MNEAVGRPVLSVTFGLEMRISRLKEHRPCFHAITKCCLEGEDPKYREGHRLGD